MSSPRLLRLVLFVLALVVTLSLSDASAQAAAGTGVRDEGIVRSSEATDDARSAVLARGPELNSIQALMEQADASDRPAYVYDAPAVARVESDGALPSEGGSSRALTGEEGLRTPSDSVNHAATTPSVPIYTPSGLADDAAQLALPRGGANLSQQRLDHIIARHWHGSQTANAGHFASGTTGRGLTSMIDDTVRGGTFRPNTAGRPGTIFEHDLGRTIGTNAAGNSTSRLRVVVDPSGNVITAFPY